MERAGRTNHLQTN